MVLVRARSIDQQCTDLIVYLKEFACSTNFCAKAITMNDEFSTPRSVCGCRGAGLVGKSIVQIRARAC